MAEDGPLLPYLLLVMQLYTSTVEKSAPKSFFLVPLVVCCRSLLGCHDSTARGHISLRASVQFLFL